MSHLLSYLAHLKIRRPFEEQPGEPPGEGGGQPTISNIDNLNGDAEITVDCPNVPGADRIEWWAGSNNEHWSIGSQENPEVSFTTDQVVFQAPRQEDENDGSFFCYRGANEFGSAPNFNCNGFTIDGINVDPDPLGTPNIDNITNNFTEQDGPTVRLGISSAENADQHDVHRVQGIQDFTAGSGNLIAESIGQAVSSYIDDSVQSTTEYSYRVRARAGAEGKQSNRVSIETLGEPVSGNYTNLPSNFTDVLFQHDCSFFPASGGGNMNASGAGVMAPHSSLWLEDGNDGEFTGTIPASQYTGNNPSTGQPFVQHGPVSPHGMPFCQRIRYSRGPMNNAATGGTSQMEFRHQDSSGSDKIPFRAIYMHYWILMEGQEYNGTRALQGGSQYRQAFQFNNCSTHNHGGLISFGQGGGCRMWGVDADSGQSSVINMGDFMTHCTFDVALYTISKGQPGDWPGPSDVPGTGAYGNSNAQATNRRWVVGDPCQTFHNSNSRVPNNAFEVGRWHKIEIIFIHSDVDTENGSLKLFINEQLVAVAEPITTRSAIFRKQNVSNCRNTGVADGWYFHPQWYRGFHTGASNNQLPGGLHGKYCSYADFYYAGIRAD